MFFPHKDTSVCICVCRVSDLNVGRVVLGDRRDGFASPVAGAVLELLARHGVLCLFMHFGICCYYRHSNVCPKCFTDT